MSSSMAPQFLFISLPLISLPSHSAQDSFNSSVDFSINQECLNHKHKLHCLAFKENQLIISADSFFLLKPAHLFFISLGSSIPWTIPFFPVHEPQTLLIFMSSWHRSPDFPFNSSFPKSSTPPLPEIYTYMFNCGLVYPYEVDIIEGILNLR